MLSPKPRLMALIEGEKDRREFMNNLTEDVIEQWLEGRGGRAGVDSAWEPDSAEA